MMRYLILYLYCIRFSFSKAMEFRIDFFFRIFMDIVFYISQFIFFKIIYLHTPILAGWGEEEITLFVASYIFIDALNMTLFNNNCWMLPIYINKGDLDFYLTKPISSLFFLSVREFAANSFVNLLLAVAIVIWALVTTSFELSFLQIFLYFVFLLLGAFLYYVVHMFFILTVFWTGSSRGLGDLFYSMSHIIERPDPLYKGFMHKIFTTILPFALMASYPARILFEQDFFSLLLHMLLVTLVLFWLLVLFWKQGLKNYSSASS